MPRRSREELVEAVKSAANIVEVAAWLGLGPRPRGRVFVARCLTPQRHRHGDRRAEHLVLDPASGTYRCYACGYWGDVISLVEVVVGVGFREAVEVLAQRYNVATPNLGDGTTSRRYNATTRAPNPPPLNREGETPLSRLSPSPGPAHAFPGSKHGAILGEAGDEGPPDTAIAATPAPEHGPLSPPPGEEEGGEVAVAPAPSRAEDSPSPQPGGGLVERRMEGGEAQEMSAEESEPGEARQTGRECMQRGFLSTAAGEGSDRVARTATAAAHGLPLPSHGGGSAGEEWPDAGGEEAASAEESQAGSAGQAGTPSAAEDLPAQPRAGGTGGEREIGTAPGEAAGGGFSAEAATASIESGGGERSGHADVTTSPPDHSATHRRGLRAFPPAAHVPPGDLRLHRLPCSGLRAGAVQPQAQAECGPEAAFLDGSAEVYEWLLERCPLGEEALAYLRGRGISEETALAARLGWVGDAAGLEAGLRAAFDVETLQRAGVITSSGAFIFRRHRLIWPILWPDSRACPSTPHMRQDSSGSGKNSSTLGEGSKNSAGSERMGGPVHRPPTDTAGPGASVADPGADATRVHLAGAAPAHATSTHTLDGRDAPGGNDGAQGNGKGLGFPAEADELDVRASTWQVHCVGEEASDGGEGVGEGDTAAFGYSPAVPCEPYGHLIGAHTYGGVGSGHQAGKKGVESPIGIMGCAAAQGWRLCASSSGCRAHAVAKDKADGGEGVGERSGGGLACAAGAFLCESEAGHQLLVRGGESGEAQGGEPMSLVAAGRWVLMGGGKGESGGIGLEGSNEGLVGNAAGLQRHSVWKCQRHDATRRPPATTHLPAHAHCSSATCARAPGPWPSSPSAAWESQGQGSIGPGGISGGPGGRQGIQAGPRLFLAGWAQAGATGPLDPLAAFDSEGKRGPRFAGMGGEPSGKRGVQAAGDCLGATPGHPRPPGPPAEGQEQLWPMRPVYLIGEAIDERTRRRGPKRLNLARPVPCPYMAHLLFFCPPGERVIVCEGPVDTLLVVQAGFVAIGVLGAGVFRPEWAYWLLPFKVYLALDADPPGRRGAQRIAHELWHLGKICKILPLPDGYDLAQWLREE